MFLEADRIATGVEHNAHQLIPLTHDNLTYQDEAF